MCTDYDRMDMYHSSLLLKEVLGWGWMDLELKKGDGCGPGVVEADSCGGGWGSGGPATEQK